jgi:hypothetical protein
LKHSSSDPNNSAVHSHLPDTTPTKSALLTSGNTTSNAQPRRSAPFSLSHGAPRFESGVLLDPLTQPPRSLGHIEPHHLLGAVARTDTLRNNKETRCRSLPTAQTVARHNNQLRPTPAELLYYQIRLDRLLVRWCGMTHHRMTKRRTAGRLLRRQISQEVPRNYCEACQNLKPWKPAVESCHPPRYPSSQS